MAGLVEGEGVGDHGEGGAVVFALGVHERQVEAGAHVGGIDRQRLLAGRPGLRRPAPFEERVTQRAPQVRRARRVQFDGGAELTRYLE